MVQDPAGQQAAPSVARGKNGWMNEMSFFENFILWLICLLELMGIFVMAYIVAFIIYGRNQ